MAVLETYTASKSIETGSTGPHADATELNPFNEQSANSLSKGFDMASSEAERYDQKQDAMWAFNQSIQLQANWRKNVASYTDPDAFQADYNANQQEIMAQAPSGRASDMFVEHSAQFGNRMIGRVVYQKIAADRAQAAQELKQSNAKLQEEGAEMGMAVKDARDQAKQAAKLAKGIAPQDLIDTITGNTQEALDRSEIANVAKTAGSATAADKIADGTLGKNLTPHENQSLLNQYKIQGDTDLATAQVNGKNFYQKQLAAIQSGQLYTKPEQDQALAKVMAASTMKKDGSNAEGLEAHYFQEITDAKNEGVMRTSLLGMNQDERQAYVSQITTENGEGSKPVITAQKIQKQFNDQIGKDPMQYAFNSQVFNDKYNAALQVMDQAKQSKDPDKMAFAQSNLKDAITAGLAIQQKGGVPENAQTVMTVPEAKGYAAQLLKGSPEDAVKTLDDLKSTYGDYFPKVMNQLQSLPAGQRVPAQFSLLADHDMNENVRNTFVSALQASKNGPVNQQIIQNGGDVKGLDKEIGKQMEPFSNALGITDSGSKASSEYAQGVSTYAKGLLLGNPDLKPQEAAQKAYDALIGSRYDVTNLNGRNTLLPRTDDQGQTIGQDQMDRMKDNLNYQHFMISTGRQDAGIDYGRLIGKEGDVPDNIKGELQSQIFKSGNWVLTPDEKNLQLVLNNQNTRLASALGSAAPSSGVKYVYSTNGNPVQIPVSSLNNSSFVWGQQSLDNAVDEFKGMANIIAPRIINAAKATANITDKGLGTLGDILGQGLQGNAQNR